MTGSETKLANTAGGPVPRFEPFFEHKKDIIRVGCSTMNGQQGQESECLKFRESPPD